MRPRTIIITHKPVPMLEFRTSSPSSVSSRNGHQGHDHELNQFAEKDEGYKATSTGPSQKGRGHK